MTTLRDDGDCTCTGGRECPACLAWRRTHHARRPRGTSPHPYCHVHGQYRKGCAECQQAMRAYQTSRTSPHTP